MTSCLKANWGKASGSTAWKRKRFYQHCLAIKRCSLSAAQLREGCFDILRELSKPTSHFSFTFHFLILKCK
uniref:Uncharacterized protein n=1 Tax=Anguilla anguilla TaxID=7936 RepID=A0A0E9UB69_ANGAN